MKLIKIIIAVLIAVSPYCVCIAFRVLTVSKWAAAPLILYILLTFYCSSSGVYFAIRFVKWFDLKLK